MPTLDPAESIQRYTGNNHLLGVGVHINVGNDPVLLKLGNKSWLMEWHYYFGPCALNKRTLDPFQSQPGEKSAFWLIAVWWKDQGCRVEDGVGLWDEPPSAYLECAVTGRRIEFWQGYEAFGPKRRLAVQ